MGRKKILLVDDEPDFLTLIKMRLETEGYDVITSLSGKDALEKVKNDLPDAVLLDILMPEMDGLEVLKKIRQENSALPVFMVTVFSADDEFDQQRFKLAKSFGATGFLFKTKDLSKEIKNITSLLSSLENPKVR